MSSIVVPMHRGHHPIWEGSRYHVDVCNMVDDVVVGDDGTIYRFPIDHALMPWLMDLIGTMNEYDATSGNAWSVQNGLVRVRIREAAGLRLAGTPPQLNIFEPGPVAPAEGEPADVSKILAAIIRERPEALVL